MKDEIKEILDTFKWSVEQPNIDDEQLVLTRDLKQLLDYITNLQKSQETLIKNDNEIITNLQEELDKEKTAKKKAIEYLPEIRKTSSYELDEKIDNLENILNGGDKE